MDLEAFRENVETFLLISGMTPTTFGKEAVGDPSFVFDLRDGREPRSATMNRVREYMREYRTEAPAAPEPVEAAE